MKWDVPLAVILASMGVAAGGAGIAAVPLLYLAAVTPELVRVDLREHRLPNRLVVPAIAVALLTVAAECVVTGQPPLTALVAGLAYPLFLLLLGLAGGMGMGDVKLAAALGLASWTPAIAILSPVIAFLAGGVAGIVLLARGRRGRIAFGPYLLAGFWAAVALVAVARFVA
jgi:leader peptidase (prepilin peptidase)/N-methyltransferase